MRKLSNINDGGGGVARRPQESLLGGCELSEYQMRPAWWEGWIDILVGGIVVDILTPPVVA